MLFYQWNGVFLALLQPAQTQLGWKVTVKMSNSNIKTNCIFFKTVGMYNRRIRILSETTNMHQKVYINQLQFLITVNFFNTIKYLSFITSQLRLTNNQETISPWSVDNEGSTPASLTNKPKAILADAEVNSKVKQGRQSASPRRSGPPKSRSTHPQNPFAVSGFFPWEFSVHIRGTHTDVQWVSHAQDLPKPNCRMS